MKTTVTNKHHGPSTPDDVYIGRPSKWGNPFSHMSGTLAKYQCATREEAVEKYRGYLQASPALMEAARKDLRGKRLVCWCAPKQCHGDILARVADGGAP